MLRFPLVCLIALALVGCASLARTFEVASPKPSRIPEGAAVAETPTTSLTKPVSNPGVAVVDSPVKAAPVWEKKFDAGTNPVTACQFGDGPRHILISASLSGNETDTVQMVESFATALASQPELAADLTVLLIRTPNPDGLENRTLTNNRGVDLNRNFPSARFPVNPSRLTGTAPMSEPETRGLVQLMTQFAPQRIVHIQSGSGSRGLVSVNKLGEPHLLDHVRRELAHDLPPDGTRPVTPNRKAFDADLARFDELKVGSVEEYADATLGIETMRIELPRRKAAAPKSISPEPFLSIALSTQGRVAPQVATLPSVTEPVRERAAAPATNEAQPVTSADSDEPRPDGKKGYVQILPPPPEYPGVGDEDPKYFELPPPGP